MAETLKRELNITAQLIEGDNGEFTVWVGDQLVAKKSWVKFPSDKSVVDAVRQQLAT